MHDIQFSSLKKKKKGFAERERVMFCRDIYIKTFLFTVPPKKPVIVDESGVEAGSFVGLYPEGSTVQISCEVTGGKQQ